MSGPLSQAQPSIAFAMDKRRALTSHPPLPIAPPPNNFIHPKRPSSIGPARYRTLQQQGNKDTVRVLCSLVIRKPLPLLSQHQSIFVTSPGGHQQKARFDCDGGLLTAGNEQGGRRSIRLAAPVIPEGLPISQPRHDFHRWSVNMGSSRGKTKSLRRRSVSVSETEGVDGPARAPAEADRLGRAKGRNDPQMLN